MDSGRCRVHITLGTELYVLASYWFFGDWRCDYIDYEELMSHFVTFNINIVAWYPRLNPLALYPTNIRVSCPRTDDKLMLYLYV